MAKASCFPVKMPQEGFPNTACILPVREGAATEFDPLNPFPCTDRGQSKELFCLVQVKGGTVFGTPILLEPPYFTLPPFGVGGGVCGLACHVTYHTVLSSAPNMGHGWSGALQDHLA